MLSDSPKLKNPKPKRKNKSLKKWHSDAKKLETVKCFLITGSHRQTAAAMNLPEPTLRTWRNTDWWKECVEEIKTEGTMTLTSRLKKVAHSALDIPEDRLQNGDFFFNNKSGEVERRGVSMRDAHRVATDLLKHTDQIERRPSGQVATEESVDAKLDHLANKFAEIAKQNNKPTVQVTDVLESGYTIREQKT